MAIVIFAGKDEETLRRGNGDRVLTTMEVQAILKVGDRALRHLILRGDLTPWEERLGNYQLFLADDVERVRQSRLKRF